MAKHIVFIAILLLVPFSAQQNTCLDTLTDTLFPQSTVGTNEIYFVHFHVPYCMYCGVVAAAWESLAETYCNDTNVHISQLDV